MTRYEQGFMNKCAEYGLTEEQSRVLIKRAFGRTGKILGAVAADTALLGLLAHGFNRKDNRTMSGYRGTGEKWGKGFGTVGGIAPGAIIGGAFGGPLGALAGSAIGGFIGNRIGKYQGRLAGHMAGRLANASNDLAPSSLPSYGGGYAARSMASAPSYGGGYAARSMASAMLPR